MPRGEALLDYGQVGWSFVSKKWLKGRKPRALPVRLEDLPAEASTKEAALILGCSKDTVLTYKEGGLLEWRDIAPPGSSRPVYRFALPSVLALRSSYNVDEPLPCRPPEPQRR